LPSDFTSKKIQDGGGRHFENWFNGYISVANLLWPIFAQFFAQQLKTTVPKQFYRQNSVPEKSKTAAVVELPF